MRGIVQKRAASVWPQDLDGEIRVVEFYVVVDFEQVSSVGCGYSWDIVNNAVRTMWGRNKINSVLATIYFISAPSVRTVM